MSMLADIVIANVYSDISEDLGKLVRTVEWIAPLIYR